jgi:O-antigen ligase
MRLWDGAYNFIDGYWIGIYFNRNSLAPVAAVAIIAAVAVTTLELGVSGRKPLKVLLVALVSSALIVFSVIEMWKSESQTSPFALAVAAGAVTVWGVLRWFGRKISRLRFLVSFAAPLTMVILGITLFIALREIGRLGGVSTEVATLNSRRAFWSLSWSAFLEKPLLGWGWMAAWRNPDFFGSGFWNPAWDVAWSHNGYLDILLGGGVLAGVLFGLFVWFSAREMSRQSVLTTALSMLFLGFVFSAATQESFFVGSHFLWALMIATLVRSSVDKQHAG